MTYVPLAYSPSPFRRSARCALVVTTLVLGCTTPEPTGGDADGSSTVTPTTTTTATDDPTLGATSMPATGDGTTETTGTASTTGTGSSGDATTDATATTDPTDTGPAAQCTGVRAFQCTEPIDCSRGGCGDPLSPFDADGCMRPPCNEPEDCEPGFACVHAEDYGGCQSSGMSCQDDPRTGECQCLSTPDCGGGHCLPEDEVPPLARTSGAVDE